MNDESNNFDILTPTSVATFSCHTTAYYFITRSVFANDKFVKLIQDVTSQRKIFEK